MLPRTLLSFALLTATSPAAPGVIVRHLGEIGQLGVTQIRGNKVDLGIAEVTAGASYAFVGKETPWRFSLPYRGDNSVTHVFAGDLDKNGRDDLMVINYLPGDNSCGTAAGDVTLLLMDSSGRPQAWQSTMRLARTGRDQDLPLYLADRNGDGMAEIGVVTCEGDTPALHAIYESRPEGVVRTPIRGWSPHSGDLRKLYRNKSLMVPKEDATYPADPEAPATTVSRVATTEWGAAGSLPLVTVGQTDIKEWPKLSVAYAGFRPIRLSSHDLSDLLDLVARSTPVRPVGERLLRTYPDDIRPPVGLTAVLASGNARERRIAIVPGEVPRHARDSSFFLIRGGDCYAFHVGSGASVGAIRSANCEAAQTMRTKGLTAASPIQARAANVWQTEAGEWRSYDADEGRERRRMKVSGKGELLTVAPVDDFLFCQWRDGGTSWLTLHLDDGTPLTGPLPVPATDQLLYVDEAQGLVFLRWDGDRPSAWIEQPARVEWRRGQ